jgi:hypothetical protein
MLVNLVADASLPIDQPALSWQVLVLLAGAISVAAAALLRRGDA